MKPTIKRKETPNTHDLGLIKYLIHLDSMIPLLVHNHNGEIPPRYDQRVSNHAILKTSPQQGRILRSLVANVKNLYRNFNFRKMPIADHLMARSRISLEQGQ